MDIAPIPGLTELEAHVQALVKDVDQLLNERLFDEVDLQLTGNAPQSYSCYVLCLTI